jgi:hypothetical protein
VSGTIGARQKKQDILSIPASRRGKVRLFLNAPYFYPGAVFDSLSDETFDNPQGI